MGFAREQAYTSPKHTGTNAQRARPQAQTHTGGVALTASQHLGTDSPRQTPIQLPSPSMDHFQLMLRHPSLPPFLSRCLPQALDGGDQWHRVSLSVDVRVLKSLQPCPCCLVFSGLCSLLLGSHRSQRPAWGQLPALSPGTMILTMPSREPHPSPRLLGDVLLSVSLSTNFPHDTTTPLQEIPLPQSTASSQL